jgi:trigger factor
MQVTETLSEGLKRSYTVVLPAADIETRRSARFADLGKSARLPGFRPGKVPLSVLRQRYGAAVTAEVVEQSVTEATQQVLSERGLRAAVQPRVDLINADPARDLEFKVDVELLPEIELPNFSTIELVRMKAGATPEAVDKALAEMAQRNREWVDLTPDELGERGGAKGEWAVVDYVGRLDGTEFQGGRASNMRVEIGGAGFIPGFAEQLEGIRPGETREITVTYPEQYPSKEVAGKQVQFEITAQSLSRAVVPQVDDEFSKKTGFESTDELRDFARTRIQREYDQLSRLRLKRQLLDRLNEMVSFSSPESMVAAEFDRIWERVEADRKQGQLDEDDQAKDEATLRADYRAIAERRVRLGLLLSEIGRTNQITVSSDEMARAMRAEAARYPGQEAKVLELFRNNPAAADVLRAPIFEDKVVDFLLELTKLTDQVVSPEELAKETDTVVSGPSSAVSSQGSEAAAAKDQPPEAGEDATDDRPPTSDS